MNGIVPARDQNQVSRMDNDEELDRARVRERAVDGVPVAIDIEIGLEISLEVRAETGMAAEAKSSIDSSNADVGIEKPLDLHC